MGKINSRQKPMDHPDTNMAIVIGKQIVIFSDLFLKKACRQRNNSSVSANPIKDKKSIQLTTKERMERMMKRGTLRPIVT